MAGERKEQNLFTEEDFNIFEDMIDAVSQAEEIVEDPKKKTIVDKSVGNELSDPEEDELLNGSEDTDEVDEDDENDTVIDDEDDSEEDSSLFTPYAKLLIDSDILSTLDINTFDGTAEGLKKAMVDEVSYHINQYKEALPAEVKRLINGYESGIPFDKMLKISSDRIRYENIKDTSLGENVDLQKSVVTDYLKKTTKFSDDRIKKTIERLENNAELEEEAKMSLTELRQLQDVEEKEALLQSQQEQKEFEKRQVETLEKLQSHITNTNEIIPGVKVNKIMKDKITKNLTVPVAYDDNGFPINKIGLYSRKNPIEFEVVLNYLFEATNEFKDFGVFGKSGKTKVIRELEEAVKSIDNTNKGVVKRITKDNDNFGILNAIAREINK